MDVSTNQPIEQLVERLRQKDLSRSAFMAILAGLGASATGIATLMSSAEADAAALPPRRHSPSHGKTHHNLKLHHEHVRRQVGATGGAAPAAGPAAALDAVRAQKLQEILDDYADHAVVEDPQFDAPISGKQAIARRKLAEMTSMAGVTLEVVHRFAHHDQVVAEWIVRGTHRGDFMGFRGTGREIEIRGVTVVTRENGKITRESLHYDVAELYRQLA